jgi:hypothetical protein
LGVQQPHKSRKFAQHHAYDPILTDMTMITRGGLRKFAANIKKYKQERGDEIKDIIYITRDEPYPHMY